MYSCPHSPGDFNNDGAEHATDYVAWRKTNGTPAGYNAWRTHFGQPAGSGSSTVAAAVPEPSMLVMLVLAAAGMYSRRGRAA